MRKPDLALERDVGAVGPPFAVTGRERRPLPHAVGGQDGRTTSRRREKRGGGVRRVVPGKQDLLPRHAEIGRDDAAHPHLFAERVPDRVRERTPGLRKRAQRRGEDPVELQHAPFVEDDGVEVRGVESSLLQAPFDGAERKTGVVLPPRQALFLHRAHRQAVDDQCGRGVVIVSGDPENVHEPAFSTGLWATRPRVPRSEPNRPARAVPRAAPATQMAAGGRNRQP